uniref:Uncharacterized protein n=1 Tax=Solanum demissum TaxID=50514 RepID=Q0KIM6_SOLDE|nr:hypothetical protein SDM1_4t00007 [Solanum demissum]
MSRISPKMCSVYCTVKPRNHLQIRMILMFDAKKKVFFQHMRGVLLKNAISFFRVSCERCTSKLCKHVDREFSFQLKCAPLAQRKTA